MRSPIKDARVGRHEYLREHVVHIVLVRGTWSTAPGGPSRAYWRAIPVLARPQDAAEATRLFRPSMRDDPAQALRTGDTSPECAVSALSCDSGAQACRRCLACEHCPLWRCQGGPLEILRQHSVQIAWVKCTDTAWRARAGLLTAKIYLQLASEVHRLAPQPCPEGWIGPHGQEGHASCVSISCKCAWLKCAGTAWRASTGASDDARLGLHGTGVRTPRISFGSVAQVVPAREHWCG